MPSCQFCNKSFPRKYNLNIHQQSAKYCLKIQETFHQNRERELHEVIKEKDKQLREKDEIIKQKDKDIKDIAMKTQAKTNITVTNNNKYNFLQTFNLTPEFIKSKIDANFTEDHFLDGQRGIAHFTFDNLLKDEEGKQSYYCTDLSRKTFIFKNRDGTISKDLKSEKLTKLIANDIIAKSRLMYAIVSPELTLDNYEERKYVTNLVDINNIKVDNSTFVTTLAGLSCNVITHENGDIIYEIIDDFTDDDLE